MDSLQIEGLLKTINIEKAFDSASQDFIEWIKTLLKNQESCVIKGGKTTLYFKLERGTR